MANKKKIDKNVDESKLTPEEKEELARARRHRIFHIVQRPIHPITGKVLLTEEVIKKAVSHSSVKSWAYILHDKDVYTEEDEEKDARCVAGSPKPPHWHILLDCPTNIATGMVCDWFTTPEGEPLMSYFIEFPTGRNAFENFLVYLTHEGERQKEQGKTEYPPENVAAHLDEAKYGGMDYPTLLRQLLLQRQAYGDVLAKADAVELGIILDGMTIEEALAVYPKETANKLHHLKELRRQWLANQNPPSVRYNIYISGAPGSGKSVLSRALAHFLTNRDNHLSYRREFFEVGASKVPFDGYDGQDVLIWDDMRGRNVIERLGSREEFFRLFDPNPEPVAENIKYGSVTLLNTVNIVNSRQPFDEFIDDLCKSQFINGTRLPEEKDGDKQVERRIFEFIVIEEKRNGNTGKSYVTVNFNKGFIANDDKQYSEKISRDYDIDMRQLASDFVGYCHCKELVGNDRYDVNKNPFAADMWDAVEPIVTATEATLKEVESKAAERLEERAKSGEGHVRRYGKQIGEAYTGPIKPEEPVPGQVSWLGEDSEDDPFDDCPFPLGGDDE